MERSRVPSWMKTNWDKYRDIGTGYRRIDIRQVGSDYPREGEKAEERRK